MLKVAEKETELSVQTYLDRINYKGSTGVSLKTLSAFQEAHLCSVPYENLGILAGNYLSLAPASLYDKIVVRRRGGYCF